MVVLLKSFAGIGVAHRGHEEAEGEGQHDDIQHEMLLARFASMRGKTDCDGSSRIAYAILTLPVSEAMRCHSPHMFSRQLHGEFYRNSINARSHATLAVQFAIFSIVAEGIVVLQTSTRFPEMHV
jgi:hypothetical protein